VVWANHSIACVEQGVDNGAKVGCALAVIAEPRAAVDMYNYWVGIAPLCWQVNVAGMESLVIAGIVHVFPLLASLQMCLLLKTSESARWLCHDTQCHTHCSQGKDCSDSFFHSCFFLINNG
jgi:hypothetical protein